MLTIITRHAVFNITGHLIDKFYHFNQFINDYRLQEAESLLQTTETPIKTIFYQENVSVLCVK